jgi:hypothetical protein
MIYTITEQKIIFCHNNQRHQRSIQISLKHKKPFRQLAEGLQLLNK